MAVSRRDVMVTEADAEDSGIVGLVGVKGPTHDDRRRDGILLLQWILLSFGVDS